MILRMGYNQQTKIQDVADELNKNEVDSWTEMKKGKKVANCLA